MLLVEMTYSDGDLSSIELGTLLREAGSISQVHEKLTTSHKPHDEEYLRLCLEYIAHANQEGMISLHENLFFKLSALNLIVIEDDIFSEGFHCIHFLRALLLYKEDLTKATSADDLLDNEVLQCHLIIALPSIQRF